MTNVVFVGQLYYSDLRPDQGLPGQPPGIWGGPPLYPDQGLPGHQPHPSHPIAPGGQPPGYWGGVAPPHPDQGLPGGQGGRPSQPIYHPGHPDHGLPSQPPGFWGGVAPPLPDQGLPPGGQEIPPEVWPQPPIPEPPPEHADDIVVAIHKPGQGWEVKAYDVQPDQGQPQPTPQSAPQSPPAAQPRQRRS